VEGLVSADGRLVVGAAGGKSGSGEDGVDLSQAVIMARAVSRMKGFVKERNFIWSIAIIGFSIIPFAITKVSRFF
jgi:hypothetical protein